MREALGNALDARIPTHNARDTVRAPAADPVVQQKMAIE